MPKLLPTARTQHTGVSLVEARSACLVNGHKRVTLGSQIYFGHRPELLVARTTQLHTDDAQHALLEGTFQQCMLRAGGRAPCLGTVATGPVRAEKHSSNAFGTKIMQLAGRPETRT